MQRRSNAAVFMTRATKGPRKNKFPLWGVEAPG